MIGNFDLFLARAAADRRTRARIDALRGASSRIVSAAGETSGEQPGRRAEVALAERLGIEVTYLPGAHDG